MHSICKRKCLSCVWL